MKGSMDLPDECRLPDSSKRRSLGSALGFCLLFLMVSVCLRSTILEKFYKSSLIPGEAKRTLLTFCSRVHYLDGVILSLHSRELADPLDGSMFEVRKFQAAGLEALKQLVAEGPIGLRVSAISVLTAIDSSWAGENLSLLARDPHPAIRAASYQGMGIFWKEGWEDVLLHGLVDPDSEVRRVACAHAVHRHPSRRVLMHLRVLANDDTSPSVKAAAQRALDGVAGLQPDRVIAASESLNKELQTERERFWHDLEVRKSASHTDLPK
jgi:hypothetical protein